MNELAGGIIHHPTVFRLGPLELTGFGLAVLLGFVIAQIICQRELWRRGHDTDAAAIPDLLLAALIGTIIGAKVYVVILNGDISLLFSRSGFAFLGGLIGAFVLCSIVALTRKLGYWRIGDVCGIAIAAGYSIGRTGCWAVGDDYGRPWSGPLSVQFPEGAPPSTAGIMSSQFGVQFPADVPPDAVIAVHPTQLYETVMGFVMFAMLWVFRKHQHKYGWLFGMYLILAGVERFIVEFFRAKDDRFIAGFTVAQVISASLVVIGLAIMAWKWGHREQPKAAAA